MRGGLADYLAEVARRGFVLGETDCCTFMADWLMRLGVADVMADRRGAYASAREFRNLLMTEGGLVAACQRRFSAAGLAVASAPRAGDVAVLLLPWRGGARATGAIAVTARHFAVVRARELHAYSTMPVARVWTCA